MNVGAITFEVIVRQHFNLHDKITWLTITSMAFLCHSKVNAVINSPGYINLLFDILVLCATAFASNTRRPDHCACSATHPTRLLHIERSLLHTLITCPAAATTFGRCSARLGFCALTRHTNICPIELDVLLGTQNRFHEINIQRYHYILSFGLCCGLATGTASFTAEHLLKFIIHITKISILFLTKAPEWILCFTRILLLLLVTR